MELKLDSAAQKAVKKQAIVEGKKSSSHLKKKHGNELHGKKLRLKLKTY